MKYYKIVFIIMVLCFLGWFFDLPFIVKCLRAEYQLKNHFDEHKGAFISFASRFEGMPDIQFDIFEGDTIEMWLQDTSINNASGIIDSTYYINSKSKSLFRVNENNCLEVIDRDTIEVCNHSWEVRFYGSCKDERVRGLLSYYGWSDSDLDGIVKAVKELGCRSLKIENGDIKLDFDIVSDYNDGNIHCFGQSEGYFEYLYTKHPDSSVYKEYFRHYEGDFYGVGMWRVYSFEFLVGLIEQ